MSDRSSQESAGPTKGSSGPATGSSSRPRRTSGDGESSSATGPESPATRTFSKSRRAGMTDDPYGESWKESETAPTLDAAGHGPRTATLVLDCRNGIERVDETGTLQSHHESYSLNAMPVLFSAADFPARISPSPEPDEDLLARAPASSSSSHESLTLFSPLADGSSLRTFPDSFPRTTAEISQSFSRRWPSSGFTTSLGESWTADTSACPRDGGASSSLRDVLEETVPARYFLSPKAAAGILSRAERRGRAIPSHLSQALQAVAQMTTTPRTGAS
jgi:hypothetical protein